MTPFYIFHLCFKRLASCVRAYFARLLFGPIPGDPPQATLKETPRPSNPDDLPLLFSDTVGQHMAHACRALGGDSSDMRSLVSTVCREVQRLWRSAARPHQIEVRTYDLFVRPEETQEEIRLGLMILDSGDGEGHRGLIFDPREQLQLVQMIFQGRAFQDAGEPGN